MDAIYMIMLVLVTLTLMQGHNGSAKAKNQHCMLSATKQAISMKLATKLDHLLRDLDLDCVNVIWFDRLVFNFPDPCLRAKWSITGVRLCVSVCTFVYTCILYVYIEYI